MSDRLSATDHFDRKILDVLAVEGRISVTELARRIGLSKSPTQARLKRLEETGVIRGYRALFDPIRLGRDHASRPCRIWPIHPPTSPCRRSKRKGWHRA